jgi:hypothetical protein
LVTEIQGSSPKAKEVLQRNAELRQKYNKFIKIGPGKKKLLTFNPEKIEQVEAKFNGKKSMRSGKIHRSRKENLGRHRLLPHGGGY